MAVVSSVVVGISLGLSNSGGLSLSGPLAVVVAKTGVSVVAKTGVSVVSKTVSVSGVSKSVAIAIVAVSKVGIGLGLGLSHRQGNKTSKNEKLHIGCSFTEC